MGHPTSRISGGRFVRGQVTKRVVAWLVVVLALVALATFALTDTKERRGRRESERHRSEETTAPGSSAESL